MPKLFLIIIFILYISVNSYSQHKYSATFKEADVNWSFILAAYDNDSAKTFHWLKQGADVNYQTEDGVTALMYAVQHNNFYLTKLLVANGADIDIVPYVAYPALTTACIENNFEICEYLIKKGANVDVVDQYGTTPLILMCTYSNFYMADMLLYYDADIDKADNDGNTPLIVATYNAYFDMAELFIMKKANIDKPDYYGNTPLMIACKQNDTSFVQLFIKKGANIQKRNNEGFDALSFAIHAKNYDIVKLLIHAGADVQYQYNKNFNPATLSMIYGTSEITSLIKENGGKLNLKPTFNNYGFTIEMPFNFDDYFVGTNFSFIDKKYNLVIDNGFRFRPSSIRILDKVDDNKYFQYWERRFLFYTGINQFRKLIEVKSNSSLHINYGIKLAYSWGSYKGSNSSPKSKFILIPNAGLFYKYNFLETGIGYEYLQFDILKKSPHKINVYFRFVLHDKFERQFN